jgi:hypothetical protein
MLLCQQEHGMGLFTDSISQIVSAQNLQLLSSRIKPQQLAEVLKKGSVDSVNFSSDAKNLFSIYETDSFFDTTFGLPASLNGEQQEELASLQKELQLFLPTGGTQSYESLYGYFSDYVKKYIEEGEEKRFPEIETALNEYVISQAVNNLLGYSNSGQNETDIFSKLGDSNFSTLFVTALGDEEQQQLGKLSLQLNRLFFQSDDNNFTSILDQFNQIYGLKNPTDTELFEATTLFENRNALLAQVLSNRTEPSGYSAFFAASSAI